jgi:hypothetical protein
MTWALLGKIADLTSIVGIVITLGGFIVALMKIQRSREAADRAARAANKAVQELRLFDAVGNVNRAISMMEEVRKLHRSDDWVTAIERYPEIRKVLISIRTDMPDLDPQQMTIIQTATQNMVDFESQAGRQRGKKLVPPKPEKLNALISRDVDGLYEILVSMKNKT